MSSPLLVTGKKVCKLVCVSVDDGITAQSNKFYNMYEQDDDTFKTERGRVDGHTTSDTFPMSRWDSTIKKKLGAKKGYTDVTHLFVSEDDSVAATPSVVVDIENASIKTLMDRLQRYANNSIEQNYTVSSNAVTQIQIDEAQSTLDAIAAQTGIRKSVPKLNKLLLELFHIIPRRMEDVRNYMVDGKTITQSMLSEIGDIIRNEQDTLDVMAGQVIINDETQKDVVDDIQQDILSMLGLEIVDGTQKDFDYVKSKMGHNANQVKAVHLVRNIAIQGKFDQYIDQTKNKDVHHFFHGSRNQNWLNIITTGLLIRPSGAIHTGSMFGDGIYFADKAQKSIGYSSLRGSHWTGGSETTGYIAMYAVHTGKQKKILHHDRSCYSLSKPTLDKDGFDSVFAQGGADLRNNEYVVYSNQQCTISHLIEIG